MTKKQMIKECERAYHKWLKEVDYEKKEASKAYELILKHIEKEDWAGADDAMGYTDHLGLEYHFSQELLNEIYKKANKDENQ